VRHEAARRGPLCRGWGLSRPAMLVGLSSAVRDAARRRDTLLERVGEMTSWRGLRLPVSGQPQPAKGGRLSANRGPAVAGTTARRVAGSRYETVCRQWRGGIVALPCLASPPSSREWGPTGGNFRSRQFSACCFCRAERGFAPAAQHARLPWLYPCSRPTPSPWPRSK
jgi:hypothetical protein